MLKKIGFFAVFLVTMCFAFIVTSKIKENMDTTQTMFDVDPVVNITETTTIDTTNENTIVPKPKPQLVTITSSKPVENGNTYSFTASVSGEPIESYHFELRTGENTIQKSSDGKFTGVPPVEGGRYTLHLVSDETSKDLVSPITVSGFAKRFGLNPSLLRSYINGFKTPSPAREKEIISYINSLGKEYLNY